MQGCTFFIILSLLTMHRSASQDLAKINVTLESRNIAYKTSCPSFEGMIAHKDHLMVTGYFTIYGLNSSFIATFGLSPDMDEPYKFHSSPANISRCGQFSEIGSDECSCLNLDNNKLSLVCNVTATCRLSKHLYFYMFYNGTYYYTKSISILQTYALCESPPGPFSPCLNGVPKHTATYHLDRSNATYSCRTGLLHGVDRFTMTGLIKSIDLPENESFVAYFGVLDRKDNKSITSLGANVSIINNICYNVSNSCSCLSFEPDGYRVACTFLASLEHSQKFGFFMFMFRSLPFMGDIVRMPLVLDKCEETPETSYVLMNITLIITLVLIIGVLLYVFLSRRCKNNAQRACRQKEQEELRKMQSNVVGESSVDGPVKAPS